MPVSIASSVSKSSRTSLSRPARCARGPSASSFPRLPSSSKAPAGISRTMPGAGKREPHRPRTKHQRRRKSPAVNRPQNLTRRRLATPGKNRALPSRLQLVQAIRRPRRRARPRPLGHPPHRRRRQGRFRSSGYGTRDRRLRDGPAGVRRYDNSCCRYGRRDGAIVGSLSAKYTTARMKPSVLPTS